MKFYRSCYGLWSCRTSLSKKRKSPNCSGRDAEIKQRLLGDGVTADFNIKNKDCVEFLRDLESDSVDLIIVDPPYFEIAKEEWDRQWSGESDYLSWCEDWTRECFRVLKPGRCFYVFGTTKTNTFLRYKLDVLDEIEGFQYNNWLIWHYEYGGKSRKSFSRKHEDCLMYSKGDSFLFNAITKYRARYVIDFLSIFCPFSPSLQK